MSRTYWENKKERDLDELYHEITEIKKAIEIVEHKLTNSSETADTKELEVRLDDLNDELDQLERDYSSLETTTYEDARADYLYDQWKDSRYE